MFDLHEKQYQEETRFCQVSNSQVNHTKVTEWAFCEGTSPRHSPLIRVLDKKPTNRPDADWPIRSLANAHRTNLGEEHFMSPVPLTQFIWFKYQKVFFILSWALFIGNLEGGYFSLLNPEFEPWPRMLRPSVGASAVELVQRCPRLSRAAPWWTKQKSFSLMWNHICVQACPCLWRRWA